MAWTSVITNSNAWTPSGSSVSRRVYSRLWYQITETATTYKIDVYGEGMIYNDNLSETINGELTLAGATGSPVTGSHTYKYVSGGTNHTDVYQALCKTASAPLTITVTKTSAVQTKTVTMKVTRKGNTSYTTTSSWTFAIPPTNHYSGEGNALTYTQSSYTFNWCTYVDYTYSTSDTALNYTINVGIFHNHSDTSKHVSLASGLTATLSVGGSQVSTYTSTAAHETYAGAANIWTVITYSGSIAKTASTQTKAISATITLNNWGKGTSTYTNNSALIVPALSTMSVTATNGNATYNGSAHYAKIKVNVAGTKVEYGTSTSYGNSLTATNANTDYTLSSVSATNVADSKTVYYRVTKAGYVTVTGHTTITIDQATPTLSVTGKTGLIYTSSAQALASAWSVTGGGTVYLGIGSSSTTAPTSWSTNASPTATNAGTYYIWAKADASANYKAVAQVYKISVTIAKANISPSVTMANWAYGGTASNPSVSGNSGSGTVTYHYKLKSAADSAYSTTKPSDAGVYTVRATIATTTNYNSGTATKDFSITFTATPTSYNAAYNGSAHSASIKTSVGGATINYGTSTSYGYSLTATNANTNYTMSSVSATNVADSKTVYYKATKNGYTVTGSTSITITKATPTLSVTGATLNYTGSAQTLVSASSVTGGGTIYYGLGSSSSSAPSSWSTTKPTATNVGTYYIWAKSDASANYNAVAQVYKASATIKPVMWLKYHVNGGTIADSPHKYSDTQYFKVNNSIVQGSSTSNGTYTDIIHTINTSTTYLNLWNITSFNVTRTGYSLKSGAAAYNTAANGTGVDVNQDNTAAGDTNPITTKRLNGGTEITANVTKTLYVNWKANTYTITLNANGGSGGTSSVNITYGTAKGSYPSITKPTRTGYTFAGFYSATSGGTQWYDANGNSVRTFDLTANTTWYAQWTINSYTLTIDPNGGSWNSSTSVSTASQNYATTKSIAAPTRTGYTFVGWAETGPGHLSKINNTDPSFDSSNGGVGVYNNSGGGTVTHTRQSSSAGATYGGYEILINASSGTTSPGNGGFYQNTQSAANQKYVHVFVAKIPVGYTVQQACNATGDGRTIHWLTSRKGTGNYQIYAYQHNCGSTGSFSTFGHVYLDTGSRPVSWQLAYSAMTNITNGFTDTYTYGAGAGRLTALWAPIVPVHVNVNGTWKTGPVWLNINGTWKQALEGYVNVNGTWKQIK